MKSPCFFAMTFYFCLRLFPARFSLSLSQLYLALFFFIRRPNIEKKAR
jgi:hypothetical protein